MARSAMGTRYRYQPAIESRTLDVDAGVRRARHILDALVVADQHRTDPAHPLRIDFERLRVAGLQIDVVAVGGLGRVDLPDQHARAAAVAAALAVVVILIAAAER